jgi:carbon monoxide dehydrogenase subunit G
MIENSVSLTLDQPHEQVFDFLVDFTNEPAWNPECIEVVQISPGPAGVGSTYRGRMRGVGHVTMELTAHERPWRFATVERSRMATGQFEFRLTPQGHGTHVEIDMRLQPRGPMRLLQPLVRRMAGRFMTALPGYVRQGLDTADLTS